MLSALLLTLCLGMISAVPTFKTNLDPQWLEWKTKYGKNYSPSEEEYRRAIWEYNMEMIDLHNKEYSEGKQSFTMGMNAFGDMNSTEFLKVMSGFQVDTAETIQKHQSPDLETSDMRENSYVHNQGRPCSYNPQNSIADATGSMYLPIQEDALMNAVITKGPICAAIDADHLSFQLYRDGIYYESSCNDTFVNHPVMVVGYGSEGDESEGKDFWLVKGSWDKQWGIGGYMKLAKDRNNHCGIATAAIDPAV